MIFSLIVITITGYGQLKAPYGIWITSPWKIDGVTITVNPAELNLIDGLLATPAELNHLVGVTSPVQTQLNGTVKTTGNQTIAGDKTFTGVAVAPTATAGTSTTQVATTAFTTTADNLKLNKADSLSGAGHYTSDHRTDLIEYNLADAEILPAPAATGDLLTGTGPGGSWVSAPPAGGGSGSATEKLQIITNVTPNAPLTGDSVLSHTAFVEKHVEVVRNRGVLLRKATGVLQPGKGYRFQKATGTLVFNPVFAVDTIIVYVTDSTTWTDLSFPSTLLDSLKGYWKLDDATATVEDNLGAHDGTAYVLTQHVAGKIDYAVEGHSAAGERIRITNVAGLIPRDGDFSVSFIFKFDVLPVTNGKSARLFEYEVLDAEPYQTLRAWVSSSTNKLMFRSHNTALTPFTATWDVALQTDVWYHAVCVQTGVGTPPKIYLNGSVASSVNDGNFSGTLFTTLNAIRVGADDVGTTYMIDGLQDEIKIWHKALTAGEVAEDYQNFVNGLPLQ